MKKNTVESLFGHVKTLPSLPVVVQKIFTSINNPKVGAKQLAEIITTDQSLTSRILRLVNSSFFGLRGKIQNVHHAVTMLGFSTIRQLCLGVSICNAFKGTIEVENFSGESFWKHSIATSVIAKEICKTATQLEPDNCYTMGLVHDIGKLLLIEHHTERYIEALSKTRRESLPLQETEESIFEIDHSDIGSWLFNKWKLPREFCSSVRNHHCADTDSISPISPEALTAITYFANELAHHLNIGFSGNPVTELEEDKFKKFFGTTFDEMDIDTVRLEEEVYISLEILGINEDVKSSV